MSFTSKIETATWFAQRPAFWSHGWALARRKLLTDYDAPELRKQATEWAAARAVDVATALAKIGLPGPVPSLDPHLITEGQERARAARVQMGGAADLELLYASVKLSGAQHVVETGVAYGWSSLAILAAFVGRDDARLISVDMPYPKMDNEEFVGIVVPERFRANWKLIREPDRHGLTKAIDVLDGRLDLCHYDSDKSYWGRKFAYAKMWAALRPGGVFISDDIQDNMYFAEFSEGRTFAVTEASGKFVGIMRKSTIDLATVDGAV